MIKFLCFYWLNNNNKIIIIIIIVIANNEHRHSYNLNVSKLIDFTKKAMRIVERHNPQLVKNK